MTLNSNQRGMVQRNKKGKDEASKASRVIYKAVYNLYHTVPITIPSIITLNTGMVPEAKA